MIVISKEEAHMLRDAGRDNDVHMSSRSKKSRGKRYFLTESYKSMKLLNDYRSERTIEVHERS